MIINFIYRCRLCQQLFYDKAEPLMNATTQAEVISIMRDSLRQNPTAKKRAAINEMHDCTTAGEPVVGIGDLAGYMLVQQAKEEEKKVVSWPRPVPVPSDKK